MSFELRFMASSNTSPAASADVSTKGVNSKVEPTKPHKVALQILTAYQTHAANATAMQSQVNIHLESRSKEAAEDQITINLNDGIYTGYHKYGTPHGFGTIIYNEKNVDRKKEFQGYFRHGKANGSGNLTWCDDRTYAGGFQEDEITGIGIMMWNDGTRYEGEFVKGKKVNGTLKLISGVEYTGGFVEDKYHGKGGVYKFPNGDRYEGDFLHGQMTGKGKKIYKSGIVFEGNWQGGIWKGGKEYQLQDIADKAQSEVLSETFLGPNSYGYPKAATY